MSDAAWYCLGFGVLALFYGSFWLIWVKWHHAPIPNPWDPRMTRDERYRAGWVWAAVKFGRPMWWIGCVLVATSGALSIASRVS